MKLDNKGFAITTIIYGILILFILVMISLLSVFVSRKSRLEKLSDSLRNVLEMNRSQTLTVNNTIDSSHSFKVGTTGKYTFKLDDFECYLYLNKDTIIRIKDKKLQLVKGEEPNQTIQTPDEFRCKSSYVMNNIIESIKITKIDTSGGYINYN